MHQCTQAYWVILVEFWFRLHEHNYVDLHVDLILATFLTPAPLIYIFFFFFWRRGGGGGGGWTHLGFGLDKNHHPLKSVHLQIYAIIVWSRSPGQIEDFGKCVCVLGGGGSG